jgi:hypothetical protein
MGVDEVEPLTEEEVERLREMLEREDRLAWLYKILLRGGSWVFGIAAALVAFRDDVSALFSWMFRGPP